MLFPRKEKDDVGRLRITIPIIGDRTAGIPGAMRDEVFRPPDRPPGPTPEPLNEEIEPVTNNERVRNPTVVVAGFAAPGDRPEWRGRERDAPDFRQIGERSRTRRWYNLRFDPPWTRRVLAFRNAGFDLGLFS